MSEVSIYQLFRVYNNLDEPVPQWNRREVLLGIVISFMLLSFFPVTFRLYIRLYIQMSPGYDDLFVFLFLVFGIIGSAMVCSMPDYGFGSHSRLLSPATMTQYLIRFYIANACYCCSTTFMKLSLLFQYLRIFQRGTILWRITVMVIVLVSLWGSVYAILAWFPCRHVEDYWSVFVVRSCWAYGSMVASTFIATYTSHTVANLALDLIVLAIPIPLYWQKCTPGRTRYGLVSLLAMGGVVNGLAIWRLATVMEHRAATYPTLDPTFYGPVSVILSCLEVDFASICASVPIFWPVLTDKLSRITVTQEVTITHQKRLSARCAEMGYSVDEDDPTSIELKQGVGTGRTGDDASSSEAGNVLTPAVAVTDMAGGGQGSHSPSCWSNRLGMGTCVKPGPTPPSRAYGGSGFDGRRLSRSESDCSLLEFAKMLEAGASGTKRMTTNAAATAGGGCGRAGPRRGSGESASSAATGNTKRQHHYEDKYIMNSVDPLRGDRNGLVETSITSETRHNYKRRKSKSSGVDGK